MLEFKMNTDLEQALPEAIEFNFDELKTELAERLDHYNHLVITEDSIKEGKADRAKLNQLRTAIDTRRKDIKKSYMQPYTEFEAKVKELTVLIDQPIKAIDTQLQAYEEQRKAEKMQQVEQAYAEIIDEGNKEIIPLPMILDKKWLNATTTMKKVNDELTAWNKRVNADLLAMANVEPEYQAAVRAKYIERLDIEAALKHRDALRAADEAFQARKAAEEAKAQEEAKVAPEPTPEPNPEPQEAIQQPEPEKLYGLRLEFRLTKKQAVELKNFLRVMQIEYKKL